MAAFQKIFFYNDRGPYWSLYGKSYDYLVMGMNIDNLLGTDKYVFANLKA